MLNMEQRVVLQERVEIILQPYVNDLLKYSYTEL